MRDFTPLIPRGVAITKGAANPTAAKTFLNWVYSVAGQQVLCAAGFTAFRTGVNCSNSLASVRKAVGSANVFLVPFRSGYADIGITAVMPRGWLCRIEVERGAFWLLSAIERGELRGINVVVCRGFLCSVCSIHGRQLWAVGCGCRWRRGRWRRSRRGTGRGWRLAAIRGGRSATGSGSWIC
jgi:hypothetical protein